MQSPTQTDDGDAKPQTRFSLSAAWRRGATAGSILILCFIASAGTQVLGGADFLVVQITAATAGLMGPSTAVAVLLACISFPHLKWARALYVLLPIAAFLTLSAYPVAAFGYPWESAFTTTARIFGVPIVALGLTWAVIEQLKPPAPIPASAALGGLLVVCALLAFL